MEIAIENLSKRFGGLQALEKISLTARSGAVTAVIGPNGAGKSTLINCLTGFFPFDEGRIGIGAEWFDKIQRQDLVDLGIARTFQTSRLWEHLTVREHILLAMRTFARSKRSSRAARTGSDAMDFLRRLSLNRKAASKPHELSYGERRRLEIARCLAVRPRLLLLDEPAAGFNLAEQEELAGQILSIASEGVAVVLVEHHMDLVGKVSSSVVVLNFGTVLMRGTIQEVRSNPEVIAAYLGVTA